MGVVNQSVKDSAAQGGVADDLVPFLDGKLAGNQGRARLLENDCVVRLFSNFLLSRGELWREAG